MKTPAYIGLLLVLILSCSRKAINHFPEPPAGYALDYGDSVFYLKQGPYPVAPTKPLTGKYEAFPKDLKIDALTGVITVGLKGKSNTTSQTGIRYRISYTAPSGQQYHTHIVLAGIHYQDKVYDLNQNQKLLLPIYNANKGMPHPGGIFSSDNSKVEIDPSTGIIDLKKSIDNGLFGGSADNNDYKQVNIRYKINDQSQAQDNFDVLLYYYTKTEFIPQNVSNTMRAHQDLLLGISPEPIPFTTKSNDESVVGKVFLDRPRPPCIILIGN